MIIQYKNLIKKDVKDFYFTTKEFKDEFYKVFQLNSKLVKIDLINFIKVDEDLKTLKFITTFLIDDKDKVFYFSVYFKTTEFITNFICEENYKIFKKKLNYCEYFKKAV